MRDHVLGFKPSAGALKADHEEEEGGNHKDNTWNRKIRFSWILMDLHKSKLSVKPSTRPSCWRAKSVCSPKLTSSSPRAFALLGCWDDLWQDYQYQYRCQKAQEQCKKLIWKKAHKLGRCDSYIRNLKLPITHPPTHLLTDRALGVGARRCYRI